MPSQPSISEPSLLQGSAWRALLRTHSTVMRKVEADLLRQHDLSFGAVEILCQLWVTPDPEPVRALASQLMTISETRASRVVQQLTDQGHLQRGADQADGRISLISLTPAGQKFAQAVYETLRTSMTEHFFAALDDDDLAALTRIWDKLKRLDAQTAAPETSLT